MDRKTYEKTTAKEFIGRKVKSLVALTSGRYKFPAGTIFAISDKYNGFDLWSDPCPHCGVSASINKVPPRNVELI